VRALPWSVCALPRPVCPLSPWPAPCSFVPRPRSCLRATPATPAWGEAGAGKNLLPRLYVSASLRWPAAGARPRIPSSRLRPATSRWAPFIVRLVIDRILQGVRGHVRHRVWVVSDLQQSKPAEARRCLTAAVEDFLALDVPVEQVWYLGDGVEGSELGALEE